MSDDAPDYEAVVPEKLKLKGVSLKKKKDKKKKKKKSRKRERDAETAGHASDGADAPSPGESGEKESGGHSGSEDAPEDSRTEAEKRFEEVQRKRMRMLAKKASLKTHRQRVDEFNNKLSQLSEHHDIPKVSSAGNG